MTDTHELIDQGYCPDCRRYVTYGELWANGDITGIWACDECLPAGNTVADVQRREAEVEVDRLREHVHLVRQRAAEGLAGASEVSTAEYELHGALRKLDALTDNEPKDAA